MIKRKKSIPESKVLTPEKLLQAREDSKALYLSSYKKDLKNNIERILIAKAEQGRPISTKFYFPKEVNSYNVSNINKSVMKEFSNQDFIINKIPIEEATNFDIYTIMIKAEHNIPNLLSFDEDKDSDSIKIGNNTYILHDEFNFYYVVLATITNITSDHIYFEYPSGDSIREGSCPINWYRLFKNEKDLIKYLQKQ